MGFGFFQGSKIKILKSTLNLNDAAEIDGNSITADRVIIADSNKSVKSSTVTTTELGYLSGATASIQSQINSLAASAGIPLGDLTVSGNLGVTGNASITGNLSVTGVSNLSGVSAGTANFSGVTAGGDVHVIGNLSSIGNADLPTITNTSIVSQSATAGSHTVTGNLLVQNELRLEDTDSGTNYVALKASTTQAANHTYTLPSAQPISDGQALVSTTAGSMSWASIPTAAPYDVSNTTFTVSASLTNTILTFNAAVNSAHIFWSLHNGVADAHQAGNSVVLKKNSSYEIINTLAGTATFGGTNLTITNSGELQLINPSVTGTLYYRILTT